MDYDRDGFVSWFLLFMVLIGLFLIYLVTTPDVVNTVGEALGSITGEDAYNFQHKIDFNGNEYITEYLYRGVSLEMKCAGNIKRDRDGSYVGSCRGDCRNKGSFSFLDYESGWYCDYCGGVVGSPQCI